MTATSSGGRSGPQLFLVLLAMAALIAVAWGVAHPDVIAPPAAAPVEAVLPDREPPEAPSSEPVAPPVAPPVEATTEPVEATPEPAPPVRGATLPGGRRTVFGGGHLLVAYYGTAGTGALGVLGETSIPEAHRRLVRAAAPFVRPGAPVQPVYELIVTIADRTPGPDGDYSHDIDPAAVRRYVEAARRQGALLLLDLQPGRADFLDVAKRWRWALQQPHVGLALDPEWRMGRGEVPGTVIGSVGAFEVNRTSAWLSRLAVQGDLPEKLFVLHQFRTSMVERIDRVRQRPRLALVQHVDGFGNQREKLATYGVVAFPEKFTMGFKLFYDEDVNRMGPREVHRIRPRVRFISFQ